MAILGIFSYFSFNAMVFYRRVMRKTLLLVLSLIEESLLKETDYYNRYYLEQALRLIGYVLETK